MFDTPDISTFCIAPLLGIIFGVLFFAIGSVIRSGIKKYSGKDYRSIEKSVSYLAIIFGIIVCLYSFAVGVGLFPLDPAPFFKPSKNNVVGTWQLNPENIYTIPISPHSMLFKDDGTFYLNNVPSLWKLEGEWELDRVEYMNGSGKWHINPDFSSGRLEWVLVAQFDEVNGKTDNLIMNFYFIGRFPPYDLVVVHHNIVDNLTR